MITNEILKSYTVPFCSLQVSHIQEMAQELLERREKDKPKTLRAPVTDKELMEKVYYWDTRGDTQYGSIFLELLEYRKRTRRTHFQRGDVVEILKDRPVFVDGWAGTAMEGSTTRVFIPLDSLKDLHE